MSYDVLHYRKCWSDSQHLIFATKQMARIISRKPQHRAWITRIDSSHPVSFLSPATRDIDIIRGNISPTSRTTNFELSLLYWKAISQFDLIIFITGQQYYYIVLKKMSVKEMFDTQKTCVHWMLTGQKKSASLTKE